MQSLSHNRCLRYALLLVILLCGLPGHEASAQSTTDQHILILYAYGFGGRGVDLFNDGFFKVITEAGFPVSNIYAEHLDLQRNKDLPGYNQEMSDMVHKKYVQRHIDLIITIQQPALDFLLTYGKDLAPQAPVITAQGRSLSEAEKEGRRIVGMVNQFDIKGTLELALRLFPQTRHVVFASGSSMADIKSAEQTAHIAAAFPKQLEFEYTTNMALDDILERVAHLSPHSVVIFTQYNRDTKNHIALAYEAENMIAKKANAPVFGLYDYNLRNGGIGGSVIPVEQLGVQIGMSALDILKGVPLSSVGTLEMVQHIPMLDWQQIRRWGGDVSKLPMNTVFLDRPLSVWQQYHGLIVGTLVFILIQLLLIVALLVNIRRRKIAEAILVKSEDQLLEAHEIACMGLWELDLTTNHLMWSNGIFTLFEVNREAFSPSYEAFIDFIHPDDRTLVDQAYKKSVENRTPYRIEHRLLMNDGRVKWVSEIGRTEYDNNGNPIRSVGTVQEITERKQAEEELRKSETRFRTLVQTIPDLIWLKDKDGVYLSCNKIFERMFGAREENIVGKTDYDFVDRKLADFFRTYDQKAIAAGKPSSNEEWVTFSDDGQRALLETIKTPMYDDKGTLIGVLGIGRDITERKRNEEALQHYAFLMKEMGKAAKIGGWEFDTATGKGTWTEEVALIHEVDPKEDTNVETAINFYTDESREKITKAIRDAIESGKPYILELELNTAKGNHKWVKTIGHPIIENNKVIKVRGSFQDVTERKRAEKEREKLQLQLTQAQKMEAVGQLAGGVAHDFNNMLGVILGYSELALEQTENNQSLQADLKEIQMAAQRSADLTRQLLAFARKQTVVPKIIDLNTTVESMLSMLRRLIGEDINLVWLPGQKPGLIKIDPSQIDQILANLCVNARDAISDNGKVTVETGNVDIDENYQTKHAYFQPGKYVLLAVSDNGCGMNEETKEKLFEPFFTTKELGKGTGLGLASVYGVVKQNNGYIDVYSELGLGTTFKIYLPQHETDEGQLRTRDIVEPAVRGNETILLVEDEPAILKMTSKMLEQLGYKVLKTNIPTEAIDLARAHAGEIKLLMTDVVMPGINGRVLAKSILPINPGLKCLFMSGYTSDVIAHHGILDDGVFFIQKPFNRQDLAAKIREALKHDPN